MAVDSPDGKARKGVAAIVQLIEEADYPPLQIFQQSEWKPECTQKGVPHATTVTGLLDRSVPRTTDSTSYREGVRDPARFELRRLFSS